MANQPESTPDTLHSPSEAADPDWFRQPTPREHRMGAALFVSFGVWFVLLFVVLGGWWFRWVILGMGVLSILHGLWHVAVSLRAPVTTEIPQPERQN